MVDIAKGVGVGSLDWAVLIRTSMGASRRSVKKRQILSQSLAVRLPEGASVSSSNGTSLGASRSWKEVWTHCGHSRSISKFV